MKIGIDTFGCGHGESGLGSYLLSLVNAFSLIKDVEFELFGSEVDRYIYTKNCDFPYSGVDIRDSKGAERQWHYLKAKSFFKKNGYDAVLYVAGARVLPPAHSVPGFTIVTDSVTGLFQNNHDMFAKFVIKKGLSEADCVIVPSNFTKKDITKSALKVRRIEIVPSGVDHSDFHPVSSEEISDYVDIKPFAIKKPYFLYPGRMSSPEKKHVELIRAFTKFKEKTGLPHRLVLAGGEDEYGSLVHEEWYKSSAASDIFITGYFPKESLGQLYRNSDGCILPSCNEGTGLTALEAMAAGIPVACSKHGALGEAAQENAIYFDPDNIDETAAAIEELAVNEKRRQELVEGGLKRSEKFTWEQTAREIVSIIRSSINSAK